MSKKWIVIVTRVEARIFSGENFRAITTLANQLGREKNRAMSDGKPGSRRSKFIGGAGLYNLTGEKNPHEDAAIAFAKRVSTYLQKQRNLHRFDELFIAAEPKMLGRVKAEMSEDLNRITEWQGKDLGKLKVHDLRKKLMSSAGGGASWKPNTVI